MKKNIIEKEVSGSERKRIQSRRVRRRFKREGICLYIWLIHSVAQQELTH